MNQPVLHENLPMIEVADLRAAQYLLTWLGPNPCPKT
jgi:hypothetical protein